ncbi:MAG: ADP-ribose pyrophosphatase [Microbacteriaceae bacterium]|nr:ADP-ribose pyrophosphatase [Microbacteriaceae bacterium]
MAELADDPVNPPIASSDVVYEGRVWNVRRDTFVLDGDHITREYIDHTGAVAILALDNDGRVLLIKQYRHPIRTRDWEIPAGLLDIDGESPLIGAKRELAEEADLVASTWHLLADFSTSPGGSNEAIRIYLARGLTAADQVFDRTEEEAGIEVRWIDLDAAFEAVLERRVANAILIVAILSAHAARAKDWATLGDADSAWPRHPKLGKQD